jgi:hypothetical protein
MNEDEYELGPFEDLYEQWTLTRSKSARDPAQEAELIATYRSAWLSGARGERVSALYFIRDRKLHDGVDLLVEALGSADPRVAGVGATLVSVSYGRDFQFGAEVRPAFRALVRRLPLNDVMRPRALYGHQPGDADDTAARPFVNLYEDWRLDNFPGDLDLAAKLHATYRETWASGDNIDRAFVLLYLPGPPALRAHEREGADLVLESLRTDDPALAPVAAITAFSFLNNGVHLGPETRGLLQVLRERFGGRTGGHMDGALRALDELEAISPYRHEP